MPENKKNNSDSPLSGIFVILILLTILFVFSPGMLIIFVIREVSNSHWMMEKFQTFLQFDKGQMWIFSILVSLAIFFLLFLKIKLWKKTLKRYCIVSLIISSFFFVAYLGFHAKFPATAYYYFFEQKQGVTNFETTYEYDIVNEDDGHGYWKYDHAQMGSSDSLKGILFTLNFRAEGFINRTLWYKINISDEHKNSTSNNVHAKDFLKEMTYDCKCSAIFRDLIWKNEKYIYGYVKPEIDANVKLIKDYKVFIPYRQIKFTEAGNHDCSYTFTIFDCTSSKEQVVAETTGTFELVSH